VQGSDCRCRGATAGEGERSQVPTVEEGSDHRWRGAIAAGGGKRSQLEESDLSLRWRGATAGGGERPQVEGSDRDRRGRMRERQQVEGSYCRWREAITGGGKQSLKEGSDCRWIEAISFFCQCKIYLRRCKYVWKFCIDTLGLDCLKTHCLAVVSILLVDFYKFSALIWPKSQNL
jgi:hypothetical protein